MEIQKITVDGAGQIGTSIVMAAAKTFPNAQITAIDIEPRLENIFYAELEKKRVSLDNITFSTNPRYAKDSDITALAVPVSEMANAVEVLNPNLRSGSIVIDVGSAKSRSIKNIRSVLRRDVEYVPCHPMNGNSGSGPSTASLTMFEDKPLIIVPGIASKEAEAKIKSLWESFKSRVFHIDAGAHDKIVGTTSHNQYETMFAWVSTSHIRDLLCERGVADPGGWLQGMLRITDADAKMWTGIFGDNREEILDTAKHFRSNLIELARLTVNASPFLDRRIAEAHAYAAPMSSPQIEKIGDGSVSPDIIHLTAFAGLLSMNIAENIRRVEGETGFAIAPIVNRSARDGMGAIAADPESVAALLKVTGPRIRPLVQDFLASYDRMIGYLKKNEYATIHHSIEHISGEGKLLKTIFEGAPLISRSEASQLLNLKVA